MSEQLACARRDATLLATALMYYDTDVLHTALDGCESDVRLVLAEAAALLHDSYQATLSLRLGRPADQLDIDKAWHDPSVDIGWWVHNLSGVWLPGPVRAWAGAVLTGDPWPPEGDLALYLAAALWMTAGLWLYCAPSGEWGNFVAEREVAGGF